jgi:hypothetical protein
MPVEDESWETEASYAYTEAGAACFWKTLSLNQITLKHTGAVDTTASIQY